MDTALDRLIVDELDRRHAAGYEQVPPTAGERVIGELGARSRRHRR